MREGHEIFTEKYRPQNRKHFVGNDNAVRLTKRFFLTWKSGTPISKSILFYGPPGVGKTSLALMLAKATKQAVIHINASDLSKKSDMNLLLSTSQMGTYDNTQFRITIVDECDRISTTGQKVLVKVIDNTAQPLILICNDLTKIISQIKTKTMSVPFNDVPPYRIEERIKQIVKEEKVKISQSDMTTILKNNRTVRGAVNALQDYCQSGEVLSEPRDPDLTEIQKLERILIGSELDLHLNLDQVNRWLTDSELESYQVPCDIDIILKRVQETQNYSLQHVGYTLAKIARGKLCSFPMSFNSIHQAKKKLKKSMPDKKQEKDEMIRLGKRKKKSNKKLEGIPEYKGNTEQDNTSSLEEFI